MGDKQVLPKGTCERQPEPPKASLAAPAPILLTRAALPTAEEEGRQGQWEMVDQWSV